MAAGAGAAVVVVVVVVVVVAAAAAAAAAAAVADTWGLREEGGVSSQNMRSEIKNFFFSFWKMQANPPFGRTLEGQELFPGSLE